MHLHSLHPGSASGGVVTATEDGVYRLALPSGGERQYRLAQLDDYSTMARNAFAWQSPAVLELQARASAAEIPGTWGFGFWNDPFAFKMGIKGAAQRLPALPDCAWFFYASPSNWLTLRADQPGNGLLASAFRSARLHPFLLVAGVPLLPLLAWSPGARALRKIARRFVQDRAVRLTNDVTGWHTYRLEWLSGEVTFGIDGSTVFKTSLSPAARLGLVFWIDNQYAAFLPGGHVRYGMLASEQAAWLEIKAMLLQYKSNKGWQSAALIPSLVPVE